MNSLTWPPAFCQSGGAGNTPYHRRRSQRRLQLRTTPSRHHHLQPLQVLDESKDIEAKTVVMNERSESDKLVDAMNFGDLCNDFECISSPSVEATARQLARDILELREGNRSLDSYSISVKYKVNQIVCYFYAAGKKNILGSFADIIKDEVKIFPMFHSPFVV